MQLRQENRTKDIIQIEKEEIKLSLFAADLIVCVENLKEFTRKLLKLISYCNKAARYMVNIQKPIAFLFTNNKQSENEINKTTPFVIV